MKQIIFSILFSVFLFQANAQKLSLDLYGGLANYQGDLQDKQFTFNESHFGGGLGLSYAITNHFSIRSAFTMTKLSADDKVTKNRVRNLNFSTNLWEAQLALQYYFFDLKEVGFSPYLFAGAALFHYDPYTFDTSGTKYYLAPLSTEGQGFVAGKDPYKLTQISIPFGAGIKYQLSDNIGLGAEIGFRKSSTDYLDDVSTNYVAEAELLANRGPKAVELAYRGGEISKNTYPAAGTMRGNPKKDWYYFTAVTLSISLGNGDGNGLFGGGGRNGWGGGKMKNSTSCPKPFR